ncbi:MAG: outer membrane beta-barrel protein [Bacteroidia bacterium]
MKKVIFGAILAISTSLSAQETNAWRWGVQLGMHGNKSEFVGGDADANARFHQHKYGNGAFAVLGRYDFNSKWALQAGIGVSSLGNEFGIAENYSFVNFSNRFTNVGSKSPILEIPLMGFYKFKPNCKDWKWFVGAGGTVSFVGDSKSMTAESKEEVGNTPYNLYSETTINKGGHATLRFTVGREKVFKSGRIFSWAFLWNLGTDAMAKTMVKYEIDNKQYQHYFENRGHYFGLRFSYFFKPILGYQPKPTK